MDDFSDDLLQGAGEIAEFLFGTKEKRRKVYHLQSKPKNKQNKPQKQNKPRLPLFYLGSMICGRKSTLLDYVRNQEAQAQAAVENHSPTPAPTVPSPSRSVRCRSKPP